MATDEPIDAAAELDRLPDWGRGSISREEIARWGRQLRRGEVWAGAAFVVAAPEAAVATVGGVLLQTEVILAFGCAMLVGYFGASVAFGPDLPMWTYRAWLFSKVAGTALVGMAVAALAMGGMFGLVVALPVTAVATVSAIGTALLRHGIRSGSILVSGMFLLVGELVGRHHFQLASDNDVAQSAAIAAFSIAAISVVLWAVSAVRKGG